MNRRAHARADYVDTDAAILARVDITETTRGKVAELLKSWSGGEITTLVKVLRVLAQSHAETAARYRQLAIVPRPAWVQHQIDYDDAGHAALVHAISVLEGCYRRRKDGKGTVDRSR